MLFKINKKNYADVLYLVVFALNFISLIYMAMTILNNGLLGERYRNMYFAIMIFLEIIFLVSIRWKIPKIISMFFMVVIIISHLVIAKYLNDSLKSLEIMNRKSESAISVKDKDSGGSYNIYLSGIDTEGNISNVSRSDVNLILNINANKKSAVIVSIPRDSYVRISGGGKNEYDKLTHSGIYGIDSSISTIENIIDQEIDYYFRVNFSSFVKLIDLIGGIDVYNKEDFTSRHGKYHFSKGIVHLDGKMALGFARERYSLSNGDLDRGRNHEIIVEAVLKKLVSLKSIGDYGKILKVMEDSIQTNMPKNKMIELFNYQLNHDGDWKFELLDIKGAGKSGLKSFAMPDSKLFMYVLDESSLKAVQNRLKENYSNAGINQN